MIADLTQLYRPRAAAATPRMTVLDLHCHSTASDGMLTPEELVDRAAQQHVDVLALTDHDTVAGLAEAATRARSHGLTLVPGVEISVSWNSATVHIVGLRLDPGHDGLLDGLARNRAGREDRARRMGEELARIGIPGAFEGARQRAANQELISRTHFARFLVDSGRVKDMKAVFRRFLIKGKPGYVTHQWASLAESVQWIHAAGGQAVLAHPARYLMGKERLRLLITEFRELGGEAIEVVSSSHTPAQVPVIADLAVEFGLLASAGSDFHAPGEGGRELGRMPAMPARCTPVWSTWT